MLGYVFFKDTATTESYTYVHTLSRHDARPSYAGLAAEIGERREQRGGRHRPAVQCNAGAPFEIDRDDLGLVGRVLGIDGARIDVIGHFLPRILEHLAFRGGVQEVRVGREG